MTSGPDKPAGGRLPYGLTWEDLAPCLPAADVGALRAARAFESPPKRGRFQGGDNSCIRTLRYPTAIGDASTVVFIKRNSARQRETEAYRFLARHRIPLPRVLLSLEKSGEEVIVLEFLPRIGIDTASRGEVDELLRLLARLNSVALEPGRHQSPPGRPGEEMEARRRAALARLALDPRARVDSDRWLRAYRHAAEATDAMPSALTHGEFAPQQAGWSAQAELVIFDLATLGSRPRFTDLVFLAELAEDCRRSELELMGTYLHELGRITGTRFDADSALLELRWLRVANRMNALHWFTHEVYGPGDEDLLQVARLLRTDMVELGLIGA